MRALLLHLLILLGSSTATLALVAAPRGAARTSDTVQSGRGDVETEGRSGYNRLRGDGGQFEAEGRSGYN